MKTVLTKSPEEAARFIKLGGLTAFPTETVYGLGADIFNEKAIQKIFIAKGRPSDNPLIAHVGRLEDIEKLTKKITNSAQKFITAFFPGPLTLVLPKSASVPLIATAGLETIGVRMPKHALANKFLLACETPVVAPSANISGKPSPTIWEAVYEDLNGKIDCILQGEPTEVGLESTVVDCIGDVPLILRPGAVSIEQLRAVVPQTKIYTAESESPKSPGLKHRHYSPAARVILIDTLQTAISGELNAYMGLEPLPGQQFGCVKICSSVDEYAHALFTFFRECDQRGIKTIYCQTVTETGIGLALMDRLKRAAQR